MNPASARVSTTQQLVNAIGDDSIVQIVVTGDLSGVPTLRLAPGRTLAGDGKSAVLRFQPDKDGVQVTRDNAVEGITLVTDSTQCALFNDTSVEHLGCLVFEDLHIEGCVRLLATDAVRSGHIRIDQLDIIFADARNFAPRPHGYGVAVVAGAFTLWNQQPDPGVSITAELIGLSAGRDGAPVRGSGIFVCGYGETGGSVAVSRLHTGAVYSDGGIPLGTPDLISAGVFVVHGVNVEVIRNVGRVTTYGPNDMVLDNWGIVGTWVAERTLTSFGASGIGFVNFGVLNALIVEAPIETFGQGARGFNVYAGTVDTAQLDRVVTHADGAVGIQISQPVGSISVSRGIETHGGRGNSLVKGVVVQLAAIAFSVKEGGSAKRVAIAGGLVTHSLDSPPIEMLGRVETFHVEGGFELKSPGAAP